MCCATCLDFRQSDRIDLDLSLHSFLDAVRLVRRTSAEIFRLRFVLSDVPILRCAPELHMGHPASLLHAR